MGDKVTLAVRTNSLESGMFELDVNEILDIETSKLIDGFCVTKVNSVEMAYEICRFLSLQEKKYGLE